MRRPIFECCNTCKDYGAFFRRPLAGGLRFVEFDFLYSYNQTRVAFALIEGHPRFSLWDGRTGRKGRPPALAQISTKIRDGYRNHSSVFSRRHADSMRGFVKILRL